MKPTIDEVYFAFVSLELSGSKFTNGPTTHTVCATREVPFLERQDGAVAIGIGYAQSHMEDKLVVIVEDDVACEIEVSLGILCVGNAKHLVLSLAVFGEIENAGAEPQDIARCLNVGFHGIPSVVVGISETHFHDEQILVVIAQYGVLVHVVLKIVFPKGV